MSAERRVWFITGAGRGMGADFGRAVLGAGDALVATGRDTAGLSKALGPSTELLPLRLDVTSRTDAEAAVRAAVERFGRIDVLGQQRRQLLPGVFRGAHARPDR
jgi:NADP-dependent 3-hydroxy acid dehydrogenase YdfG